MPQTFPIFSRRKNTPHHPAYICDAQSSPIRLPRPLPVRVPAGLPPSAAGASPARLPLYAGTARPAQLHRPPAAASRRGPPADTTHPARPHHPGPAEPALSPASTRLSREPAAWLACPWRRILPPPPPPQVSPMVEVCSVGFSGWKSFNSCMVRERRVARMSRGG